MRDGWYKLERAVWNCKVDGIYITNTIPIFIITTITDTSTVCHTTISFPLSLPPSQTSLCHCQHHHTALFVSISITTTALSPLSHPKNIYLAPTIVYGHVSSLLEITPVQGPTHWEETSHFL